MCVSAICETVTFPDDKKNQVFFFFFFPHCSASCWRSVSAASKDKSICDFSMDIFYVLVQ